MEITHYKILKFLIITGIIFWLIIFANKFFKNKSFKNQKIENWQTLEKEVDTWTDALGMPIDPKIKDIVIVLNLLGFKTEQSCQGHIDHGRAYPWVAFLVENRENNEKIEIFDRIKLAEEKLEEQFPNLTLNEIRRTQPTEELSSLYSELHKISDKIEINEKKQLKPIKDLLNRFYRQHKIDLDSVILLQDRIYEIYSYGGDWQIIRDPEEKLVKLKKYQDEMEAFTTFLVHYYFNN